MKANENLSVTTLCVLSTISSEEENVGKPKN